MQDRSYIAVRYQIDDRKEAVLITYDMSFTAMTSGQRLKAARAYIENSNIVIQIDESESGDFSDNTYIRTIILDTTNNKWTLVQEFYTTSNYDFYFDAATDTPISYDVNNVFSSNFSDMIISETSYTITIGENTYSVEFDNDGNLTKVNGIDLVDGKVTIEGTTYNFSGNTSSITYSESNVWKVDDGLAKYGTDSETLITISGLKNPSATDGAISGLTLDETAKTVTVASDLLGENDVTITSDD